MLFCQISEKTEIIFSLSRIYYPELRPYLFLFMGISITPSQTYAITIPSTVYLITAPEHITNTQFNLMENCSLLYKYYMNMEEKIITKKSYKNIKITRSSNQSIKQQPSVDQQPLVSSRMDSKQKLSAFVIEMEHHLYSQLPICFLAYCRNRKIQLEQVTFQTITRLLKERIQRMIKHNRRKRYWGTNDVIILAWVVGKMMQKYGVSMDDIMYNQNQFFWNSVAKIISGVTPTQCMFKWFSFQRKNAGNHQWSQEENILLKNIVEEIGCKKWKLVSVQLFERRTKKIYRHPKQCRQHWKCFLNPQLRKGPWDEQEDLNLLVKIVQTGNKKWSSLSKKFEGRTENSLKNRYKLIYSKMKKWFQSNYKQQLPDQIDLIKSYVSHFHKFDLNEASQDSIKQELLVRQPVQQRLASLQNRNNCENRIFQNSGHKQQNDKQKKEYQESQNRQNYKQSRTLNDNLNKIFMNLGDSNMLYAADYQNWQNLVYNSCFGTNFNHKFDTFFYQKSI